MHFRSKNALTSITKTEGECVFYSLQYAIGPGFYERLCTINPVQHCECTKFVPKVQQLFVQCRIDRLDTGRQAQNSECNEKKVAF